MNVSSCEKVRALYFSILIVLGAAMTGCPGAGKLIDNLDDCRGNVAGCNSDEFSCPEAINCYDTKSQCKDSAECLL